MQGNISDSTPQTEPTQNQPVNGQPTTPPTEISSLARMRAAQQASAPAASAPEAGSTAPSGQQAPDAQAQAQRSEYIPRERFDQVNDRLRQAEARLAAMQGMSGMQPVAQQAPQPTSYSGMAQPQMSGQAIAQSPQVQGLLDTVKDKTVQEKWRQKITDDGVTGLAEFVKFAIETEGAALLQQALAPLQQQLAPLQQTFVSQQIAAYAQQRESDPSWQQVAPTFYQLASQAAQRGQALNSQVLSVVEAVARQHVGVPIFGAPAAPQPPFTERPGSGGQNLGTPQEPNLTPQQLAMAQKFNMTPQEYAQSLASFRRA